MAASKVVTTDKNMFSVSIKVTILKISQKSRKTSVPESFFKKNLGRGPGTLLQRDSIISTFFKFCKIFKISYIGNVCE